jgi:hypothetical protein
MPETTPAHFHPADCDDEQLVRHLAADDHWLGGRIRELAALVGGIDALLALDATPQPEFRVDPTTIDARSNSLSAVIDAIEHPALTTKLRDSFDASTSSLPRLYDDEIVTIAHRVLDRVLGRDPAVVTAAKDPDRVAAALVWIALRASRMFERRGATRGLASNDLWHWFDVIDSTKLALRLVTAAGCPGLADDQFESARRRTLVVADARLLHSLRRSEIANQRDEWIQVSRKHLAAEHERRPIRPLANGQVALRAVELPPLLAVTTVAPHGRRNVVVGFGHDHDDAALFALSVPEARRLIALVERALGEPDSSLSAGRMHSDRERRYRPR